MSIESQGYRGDLSDHFKLLSYLFDEIKITKIQFEEEEKLHKKKHEAQVFQWLAGCAEASWQKCRKYYKLADQSAAYYAAMVLDPTQKFAWLEEQWENNEEAQKDKWLEKTKVLVRQLWKEEYYGKYDSQKVKKTTPKPQPEVPQDEVSQSFFRAREFKRLKITTPSTSPPPQRPNLFEQYLETNRYVPADGEIFDPIKYWNNRYETEPDLARFALDMLAIPPAADACERLFSSTKLLITDLRSRLKMDIIEANECLRSWYGPPKKADYEAEEDEDIDIPIGDTEVEMEQAGGSSDGGSKAQKGIDYDSDVEDAEFSDIEGVESDIEGEVVDLEA